MNSSTLRTNPKPDKPHIHRIPRAGMWRASIRPSIYRSVHFRYADTARQAYHEALEVGYER